MSFLISGRVGSAVSLFSGWWYCTASSISARLSLSTSPQKAWQEHPRQSLVPSVRPYSASNSFKASSRNFMSSGSMPPPAKCPIRLGLHAAARRSVCILLHTHRPPAGGKGPSRRTSRWREPLWLVRPFRGHRSYRASDRRRRSATSTAWQANYGVVVNKGCIYLGGEFCRQRDRVSGRPVSGKTPSGKLAYKDSRLSGVTILDEF